MEERAKAAATEAATQLGCLGLKEMQMKVVSGCCVR